MCYVFVFFKDRVSEIYNIVNQLNCQKTCMDMRDNFIDI
jgi:hypothetical protein